MSTVKPALNTEHNVEHDAGHVHGPNCQHDHHDVVMPYRRETAKIGRNDPCHCGSGKKFKKCHGAEAA
jgi:uncharacterized protein YecA (UPF0149 family)